MIPSPTLILGAILALILSCGGAFIGGYKHGYNVSEGEQAKIDLVARKVQEAAAIGTASEIAKIKVTNTTIHNRLEKEVYEKPVYLSSTCRHTADGLLDINAALAGSVAISNLKLPGTDAIKK